MVVLKVVVLGDSEVGKTSFTQRYTKGTFPDPNFLRTTIGASFDTLKTALPSGRDVTLSIWDFGGQQRFIEQLKAMIKGASVGLLFYDVTTLQSLDNIESYWIPIIEENSELRLKDGDGSRFIITGNKIDLIDSERIDAVVNEMMYYAETYQMRTCLISAKTGVGIEKLDMDFLQVVDSSME